MKLLLSSKLEDLDVLKELLAQEGIPCKVTNDNTPLRSAESQPKLWVVADADFNRALAVLDSFRKLLTPKSGAWICPVCGQRLEEQFSSCWKCATGRHEAAG